jgi:hypothetical protein
MLEEVREALDLALRRLLALKRPDGSWESAFEISAFLPSLYIIMLRTTGLIESPGARENEIDVLRHMVTLVNDDGGFFAYPESPSSRSLSRLARGAVLLVLGEIPPAAGTQDGFRRIEESAAT